MLHRQALPSLPAPPCQYLAAICSFASLQKPVLAKTPAPFELVEHKSRERVPISPLENKLQKEGRGRGGTALQAVGGTLRFAIQPPRYVPPPPYSGQNTLSFLTLR